MAQENGHKTRKCRVFCDALKHVSGTMVVVNSPGTSKPWGISHENDHKRQKQRVFGHNSQTCKAPWNPQNVSNSTRKRQ